MNLMCEYSSKSKRWRRKRVKQPDAFRGKTVNRKPMLEHSFKVNLEAKGVVLEGG